jgi:DNA-binding GntR family transcriptional regulator
MSQPGRPEQAVKEMRALVEAIAAGEVTEAVRLSRAHLDNASSTVATVLDDEGGYPGV